MTTPLRRKMTSRGAVTWLVVTAMFMLMLLVWAQSYAGRATIHRANIAGCERGRQDRMANARSWRVQADADWVVGHDPTQSLETQRTRTAAAAEHLRTAAALEQRARIVCAVVYPAPKLLP